VYLVILASLASSPALGPEIIAHHARIDVGFNNVRKSFLHARVTVDGYADMVAVNYLAPWRLTTILRETWPVGTIPYRHGRIGSLAPCAGLIRLLALTDKRPFNRTRFLGGLRPDQVDE